MSSRDQKAIVLSEFREYGSVLVLCTLNLGCICLVPSFRNRLSCKSTYTFLMAELVQDQSDQRGAKDKRRPWSFLPEDLQIVVR